MDIWTSLGAFAFFESERLSFRPLVFLDRFDLHEIVSNPENLQFSFLLRKLSMKQIASWYIIS